MEYYEALIDCGERHTFMMISADRQSIKPEITDLISKFRTGSGNSLEVI